jgi:hypothetical protein
MAHLLLLVLLLAAERIALRSVWPDASIGEGTNKRFLGGD